MRERWFAEPMHNVRAVWGVHVVERFEGNTSIDGGREVAHPGHDVDDRLGDETRNGSATDVFDRARQPRRQELNEPLAFFGELARPFRIVGLETDRLFSQCDVRFVCVLSSICVIREICGKQFRPSRRLGRSALAASLVNCLPQIALVPQILQHSSWSTRERCGWRVSRHALPDPLRCPGRVDVEAPPTIPTGGRRTATRWQGLDSWRTLGARRAVDRHARATRPLESQLLSRQFTRLLHPLDDLFLVELVVLADVQVAHLLLLGLAGRERTE